MIWYSKGYYYEANDVKAGSTALLAAIETHDASATGYLQRQRALIERYLPGDVIVTATYTALLDELVRRPSR